MFELKKKSDLFSYKDNFTIVFESWIINFIILWYLLKGTDFTKKENYQQYVISISKEVTTLPTIYFLSRNIVDMLKQRPINIQTKIMQTCYGTNVYVTEIKDFLWKRTFIQRNVFPGGKNSFLHRLINKRFINQIWENFMSTSLRAHNCICYR